MAYANPTAYTKGQINRSGQEVRTGNPSEEALLIVNNWRASHAYILNTFNSILRSRTRGKKIGVAQRHKRMRTIASKLGRLPKMELARMDDIAGCRLIKGATSADIRLSYKSYFSDPNDFIKYIEEGSRKLA